MPIPTNNKKHDWYSIDNKETSTDIFIYDVVGWETTAKDFVRELRTIKNEINLHLNTPGGDVFDGNSIYNELKSHPSKVNVYIDGLAASIGSIIAMSGDTINIAKNGFMMIHNPFTMAMGNAEEIRKTANMLDKVRDSLVQTYIDKTGQSKEQIVDWMDQETWFDSNEALAAGFATNIVEDKEIEDVADLRIYNHVPKEVQDLYQVSNVNNEEVNRRNVERTLRDAGYSRKVAREIVKSGIKDSDSQRDADVQKIIDRIDNIKI